MSFVFVGYSGLRTVCARACVGGLGRAQLGTTVHTDDPGSHSRQSHENNTMM